MQGKMHLLQESRPSRKPAQHTPEQVAGQRLCVCVCVVCVCVCVCVCVVLPCLACKSETGSGNSVRVTGCSGNIPQQHISCESQ